MLVQHLLTERLFHNVFDNHDFTQPQRHRRRDREGDRCPDLPSFSRHEFLKALDRFYVAIETPPATLDDFSARNSTS